MDSDGNLRMVVFNDFTNLSALTAYNNLDLHLYGAVTNRGYIASTRGNTSLDIHNNLINNGNISGTNTLKLKLLPISTIDNYGTISAGANLNINARYLNNRDGALISARKAITTHRAKIVSIWHCSNYHSPLNQRPYTDKKSYPLVNPDTMQCRSTDGLVSLTAGIQLRK